MADWSPFYVLPQAELSSAGLLKIDTTDQEVELLRRTNIELRYDGDEPMGSSSSSASTAANRPKGLVGDWSPRTANLSVIVTTHRLVMVDTNHDHRFIHLSNVHIVRGSGGPSFQHPRATYKVILSTYTYGDVLIVFRSNLNQSQKDRDVILQQLETCLTRKSWESVQRLQERQATQNAAARRRVGVDHILTKQKLQQQQARTLASQAFDGDTNALLEQAGELLQVIQKSKALLDKFDKDGSGGGSGRSAEDREAAEKLAGLLSDMGMTSALTKSQIVGSSSSLPGTGSGGNKFLKRGGSSTIVEVDKMTASQRQYYELTARQVADFLLPRLQAGYTGRGEGSSKGIMSLTDVYCLFNRARGTNLISPEDLRQACALLNDLNVGLSQKTFPSGIIVVQLDSMAIDKDHSERTETILNLCRPSTTALEASHVLDLPPILAMEQLEEAERLGILCRDTTLETIRFYPNRFVEW